MTAVTILKSWGIIPNSDLKVITLCAADTTDQLSTLAITLSNYGISATGLLTVIGWSHSTSGSILVKESITTAVAAGVLTVTFPVGFTDEFRVIQITGRADIGVFA